VDFLTVILLALVLVERVERIVAGRRWAATERDLLNRIQAGSLPQYAAFQEQSEEPAEDVEEPEVASEPTLAPGTLAASQLAFERLIQQ
jgi:hypothetical protein